MKRVLLPALYKSKNISIQLYNPYNTPQTPKPEEKTEDKPIYKIIDEKSDIGYSTAYCECVYGSF